MGFEYRRERGCLLSVLRVVQVEVSETDRLLVRRNRTECCVYECDLETSAMRKPRATRPVELRTKKTLK